MVITTARMRVPALVRVRVRVRVSVRVQIMVRVARRMYLKTVFALKGWKVHN